MGRIRRRLRHLVSPPPPPAPPKPLPVPLPVKLPAEHLSLMRETLQELQTVRKSLDVLRISATADIMDDVQQFVAERQIGFLETVDRLADSELSFSRFGDGEMRMMLRLDYNLRFQQNSLALASALRGVLSDVGAPGFLLGFPHPYRDLHWSGVWADIWREVKPMFGAWPVLGNSHVSRPIFFLATGDEGVDAWRRVWAGRDVVVVTGQGSRFTLIDALFDNVRSVEWVHSTPRDAFADLPRLEEEISGNPRGALHLVALGPAGTVLSHRLARLGYRAIDVGHISDSYQVAFEGGDWPEAKPLRARQPAPPADETHA